MTKGNQGKKRMKKKGNQEKRNTKGKKETKKEKKNWKLIKQINLDNLG